MTDLEYCIRYLLSEINSEEHELPESEEEQELLWRSLVNVREPRQISEEYLLHEDAFLKKRRDRYPCIDVGEIGEDVVSLWQGDILNLKCDAIVNPANEQGLGCFTPGHGCLDNQITTYAGVRLRLEDAEHMKERGYLRVADVMVTKGYNLLAEYVLHTVGPVWRQEPLSFLRRHITGCYVNCLSEAEKLGVRTIAFPAISTGVFGVPMRQVAALSVKACRKYVHEHPGAFDKIILTAYTGEDLAIFEKFMDLPDRGNNKGNA